jgi:hypothetical protein
LSPAERHDPPFLNMAIEVLLPVETSPQIAQVERVSGVLRPGSGPVSWGEARGPDGVGRRVPVYGVGMPLTRVVSVLLPGFPSHVFSPSIRMAIFLPPAGIPWWLGIPMEWGREWLAERLPAMLPRGSGFVGRVERVV